mmetsp:Transcript_46325/g.116535  ORF Transcript_46325/g.116535 Transcript_46325/m.116535 type:complete len:240 (-) Transcript_46325:78-797(-)
MTQLCAHLFRPWRAQPRSRVQLSCTLVVESKSRCRSRNTFSSVTGTMAKDDDAPLRIRASGLLLALAGVRSVGLPPRRCKVSCSSSVICAVSDKWTDLLWLHSHTFGCSLGRYVVQGQHRPPWYLKRHLRGAPCPRSTPTGSLKFTSEAHFTNCTKLKWVCSSSEAVAQTMSTFMSAARKGFRDSPNRLAGRLRSEGHAARNSSSERFPDSSVSMKLNRSRNVANSGFPLAAKCTMPWR